MWNPCGQPWTLLATAGIVFLAVMTFRAFCPDKARPWQLGIPVAIVVAAFALDWLVATDAEKIRALILAAEKAGQARDITTLEHLVAEDYRDSFHRDKRHLIDRARTALTNSPIKGIKEISYGLENLDPPRASVALIVVATFQENSLVASTYRPVLMAKLDFLLTRQPDRRWLIESIELVEVDKQPLTWSRTTGF
jgi:hypothetical protein